MIVKEAIERGYLKSEGKTPHGTMSSVITRDIRDKGSKSAFESLGNGTFRLRQPKESKKRKLEEMEDIVKLETQNLEFKTESKDEKSEITVEIKEIQEEEKVEEDDQGDFQQVWNLIDKESEALNHLLMTNSNK